MVKVGSNIAERDVLLRLELATAACRRFLSGRQLFGGRARGAAKCLSTPSQPASYCDWQRWEGIESEHNFLYIQQVLMLFIPYLNHVKLCCGRRCSDPLAVFHMNLTFLYRQRMTTGRTVTSRFHDPDIQHKDPDSTTGQRWGPSLSGPFLSQWQAGGQGVDAPPYIHFGNF